MKAPEVQGLSNFRGFHLMFFYLDNRIQQVDTSLMGTATGLESDVNRLSSDLAATTNKVGK